MPYKEKGRKRNPWRGTVTFKGERHSEMFPTEKEAKRWEVETLQRLTEQERRGSVSYLDVSNAYLDWCASNRKSSTTKRRTQLTGYFGQAVSFLFDDPTSILMDDLTVPVIVKALDKVAEAHTNTVANNVRTNLAAMWHWAMKRYDEIQTDPFIKVPTIEQPDHERQALYTPSDQDIQKMLSVCAKDERLWLEVYLMTGGRENEVNTLRWEDVDFELRTVTLWSSKVKTNSFVPQKVSIGNYLLKKLLEHRGNNPDSVYVFENGKTGDRFKNLRKRLKDIQKRAGVRSFGFHGLRRFTGSSLARAGRPAKEIQEVLRHKNLSVTERYIHGLRVETKASVETLQTLVRSLAPEDIPQIIPQTNDNHSE